MKSTTFQGDLKYAALRPDRDDWTASFTPYSVLSAANTPATVRSAISIPPVALAVVDAVQSTNTIQSE